ncbi:MAG: hypothetical protein IJD41_03150 [Alphaproteobacteria bacterium]|nr:hypothetical protein [Alphaproteobacteria bacterium]MBQ7127674.1 hypothetical protein [Alphaproteobacteria bacterium]
MNMTSHKFSNCCKNAIGTVFLLGGAFLTCSTLMSMRAAFADPIAPVNMDAASPRAMRATRSGRASPRATTATTTVSRGTTATTTPSRATASRGVAARTTTRTTATPSRNVVARTATTAATNPVANRSGRNVRARSVDASRVSLQGNAIRGSKASTTNYSYLNSKLYTGNYSNIIDSSTGLISADAFNNCMESYYTCMDEICTARNAAQRRCACAGRVKAFAEAETQLETANEELIKVSGELALLIANKGKDISTAFQLTDAEKVMNCVSWKDVTSQYGASSDQAKEWCSNHGFYGADGGTVSTCSQPSYCTTNDFGFDIANIDGSSSDILASLQAWAKAKDQTVTILKDNEDDLMSAFEGISNVVGNLAGISGSMADENLKDSLAETWGYELFEYAHNNVCSRVLDSCFNGIYEACGTPPSGGRKCGNGQSQCPYNYNSQITVNNTGTYELNFVTANSGYTTSNSATCFGYSTASGDPYASLRGPVADARRSIMQKYALDANADCDVYGEQLRQTAQNIAYQKVAAQQALQQKRLEFATEEKESVLSAAVAASTNFNNCLSEIYDCYETQREAEENWSDSRIKTYCAQVANVPSCYEEMICNPSMAQFKAVIDEADSASCTNSQDYTTNTCRNVVTLNEILNGTGATDEAVTKIAEDAGKGTLFGDNAKADSAALREQCLQEAWVDEIRDWTRKEN